MKILTVNSYAKINIGLKIINQRIDSYHNIETVFQEVQFHDIITIKKINDLDSLPIPAWELFPLHNYWKLKYAHGPLSANRYLPMLTSRGCPYACRFCVIPKTNNLKWRARSATHVVDEMEHWFKKLGIREF